jgi:hypothetical protein
VAGGSCPHRAAKLAPTYDVPASRESTATSSQDAARIFAGFADRYTDRCRDLAETRRRGRAVAGRFASRVEQAEPTQSQMLAAMLHPS